VRKRNLGSGQTICGHCEMDGLEHPQSVVHEGGFEDGGVAFVDHLGNVHHDRFLSLTEETRKRLLARTPAETARDQGETDGH